MRVIFHLFMHNGLLLSIREGPLYDGTSKKKKSGLNFTPDAPRQFTAGAVKRAKMAGGHLLPSTGTKGHHTDQFSTASPDDKNRHVGDKNNYFKHIHLLTLERESVLSRN